MSLTPIGWTASLLQQPVTLSRDLRVDNEVLLPAGRHAPGAILPGFTFNGWTGCEKVSRACKRCYAEAWAKRAGYTPEGKFRLRTWGPAATTPRVRTSAANWKRPLAWNRVAEQLGTRLKVFAHSLSDVGENHPMVEGWRGDLFDLIEQTRHLDWLLLTKRPGHLAECWPRRWNKYTPKNIWVGTTAEDQACAEERVPEIIQINAAVHFVSCEPLAGSIDLKPWLYVPTRCEHCWSTDAYYDTNPDNLPTQGECLMGVPQTGEPGAIRCRECDSRDVTELSPLGWVIAGGESGPGHEPLDLSWLESLHAQAAEAGVPFFCKQDSGQHPGMQGRIADTIWNTKQFPLRGEVVSHVE